MLCMMSNELVWIRGKPMQIYIRLFGIALSKSSVPFQWNEYCSWKTIKSIEWKSDNDKGNSGKQLHSHQIFIRWQSAGSQLNGIPV